MKKYVKVKPNTCLKLKTGNVYELIDCCIDKSYVSGIRITIKKKNTVQCYDAGYFIFQDSAGNF